VAVDVTDAEAVENAVARIEAELGEIQVSVNDPFTCGVRPFTDVTPEEFRRVTEAT
jgi:NAD(P)-dependent dehydrogenase (short-subunit alcohol dehydrogenase family)